MVYYLTLHSCACIGIVETLRTTRRSASAREQLHHPQEKHGREGGRRPRMSGTTAHTKRHYRLQSGTTALPSGTTALPVRSHGPLALYPSPTYPFVAKTINRPPPPPF